MSAVLPGSSCLNGWENTTAVGDGGRLIQSSDTGNSRNGYNCFNRLNGFPGSGHACSRASRVLLSVLEGASSRVYVWQIGHWGIICPMGWYHKYDDIKTGISIVELAPG